MTAPPLSERDFMAQVLELAHLRGWESFHPRPARTLDSWRTAGTGTMAKGWPDLVLVHPEQRRLLFVELKRDGAKLSADQVRVQGVLNCLISYRPDGSTIVETYVWRPTDWPFIETALGAERGVA